MSTCADRLALRLNLRLIAIFAASFLLTAPLHAQQAGHYVGGATGLENGSSAPPGAYIIFLPYLNHVNSIKGPRGNSVLDVNFTVVANMPMFAETMPWKVFGGTYGWVTIFPVLNTRFGSAQFNASQPSADFSDLFFAPVVLGWTRGNADFTVNLWFLRAYRLFRSGARVESRAGLF